MILFFIFKMPSPWNLFLFAKIPAISPPKQMPNYLILSVIDAPTLIAHHGWIGALQGFGRLLSSTS
jgi:hypothetical protein